MLEDVMDDEVNQNDGTIMVEDVVGEKDNLDEGTTDLEDVGEAGQENLNEKLDCNQVENEGFNCNNEEYEIVNENEGTTMVEHVVGENDNLDEGSTMMDKETTDLEGVGEVE